MVQGVNSSLSKSLFFRASEATGWDADNDTKVDSVAEEDADSDGDVESIVEVDIEEDDSEVDELDNA